MVDHISPQGPGIESVQRLTHFSQDIDQITELPCLAERILSEFCYATHRSEGSLYLLIEGPQRFDRLAIHGSTRGELLPATITLNHPLRQRLTLDVPTLDSAPLAHDPPLATRCHILPSTLACHVDDIVIPLRHRNRLIAFVILWSERNPMSSNLSQREFIPIMAQMAANALNSNLLQETYLRSGTLMRCTDRLRSLECMADSFAHAIRNPLTSIKTFIQLAGERRDDPQFVSNFSQMALEDVSRIERLTQEIFGYTRYSKPNLAEEDVNDIVTSCLYFLEFTIKHRRIKIEKYLAPEPPRGIVNRHQLQHAFLNLLFNAVEALEPQGGVLRIRTDSLKKPDGTVWSHVDIEDTGHGIATENLEQIFDPFFTTKHRDEEPERSGLGLTIARQIIEAHQGQIHVRSTEGVGTVFSVHFLLCTA